MSLKVLVACPEDQKLFMDLIASCIYSKRLHPELTTDVLIPSASIPSWWSFSSDWLKIHNSVDTISESYDLITQLHPSPEIAEQLSRIRTQHRSGIVKNGSLVISGRWAQTFLAQIGARKFGPFAPHDLFNNILLGRTAPHSTLTPAPNGGKWIVDVESFPTHYRTWAEGLLSQVNFTHPNKAMLDIPLPVEPSKISFYIGCNETIATWLSFHKVPVILLHENELNPKSLLAGTNVWYQKLSTKLTAGQILSLTKNNTTTIDDCQRYTDEYLGGLVSCGTSYPLANVEKIFDLLHYIVLNYLNDLKEVDLPIPAIGSSCCLQLKGTKSVMTKLIHLNQFGMKFLQDFLQKVADGSVTEKDIQDITLKAQEIDDLTEKTLINYPELDVFRFSFHFAKSSAQGNNMIEVAKSLILIFHEFNQVLQIYSELIDTIVKRHTAPSKSAGA